MWYTYQTGEYITPGASIDDGTERVGYSTHVFSRPNNSNLLPDSTEHTQVA